jgi:probable addiction module antidote protein
MPTYKQIPEFDPTPYLNSKEAIAAYLTDILATNNTQLLTVALNDITRACGIEGFAKPTGKNSITLDTVNRICAAVGVRLVVIPTQSS